MLHAVQLATTISFKVPLIKTSCFGQLYCTTSFLIKISVKVSLYSEVSEGFNIRGKRIFNLTPQDALATLEN